MRRLRGVAGTADHPDGFPPGDAYPRHILWYPYEYWFSTKKKKEDPSSCSNLIARARMRGSAPPSRLSGSKFCDEYLAIPREQSAQKTSLFPDWLYFGGSSTLVTPMAYWHILPRVQLSEYNNPRSRVLQRKPMRRGGDDGVKLRED